MRIKSVLKIGLLIFCLCSITACKNNITKIKKDEQSSQESVENNSETFKEDNSTEIKKDKQNSQENGKTLKDRNSKDISKYNSKTSVYDITTKTYEKGDISIKYPQFKAKDGLEDNFTRKWNRILEDDSMSGMIRQNIGIDGSDVEEKASYYDMSYEVETYNNSIISLTCYGDYYFSMDPHPVYFCNAYNIDISTSEEVRLKDDPNFDKYVENIFYDKNYSLLPRFSDAYLEDEDTIKVLKEDIYRYLERSDISKLKKELENCKFYYKNGKTIIIFDVNHAYGDYVLAVME